MRLCAELKLKPGGSPQGVARGRRKSVKGSGGQLGELL